MQWVTAELILETIAFKPSHTTVYYTLQCIKLLLFLKECLSEISLQCFIATELGGRATVVYTILMLRKQNIRNGKGEIFFFLNECNFSFISNKSRSPLVCGSLFGFFYHTFVLINPISNCKPTTNCRFIQA